MRRAYATCIHLSLPSLTASPLPAPFSSPLNLGLPQCSDFSVITSIHPSLLSGSLDQHEPFPVDPPCCCLFHCCLCHCSTTNPLPHSLPIPYLELCALFIHRPSVPYSISARVSLRHSASLCLSASLASLSLPSCRWMWTASLEQTTLVPQRCS